MDVARDGSGLTVLAWTNTYDSGAVHPGCSFAYYDIHYLVSPDHGRHWYGKPGLISSSPFPAGFPVDGTDSGPSFALLDPSELSTSCPEGNPHYNWLENVYTQDDKLLFVYGNAPQGRETYRRVAWNPRTHKAQQTTSVRGAQEADRTSPGSSPASGTANAPIIFTSAGSDNRIITLDSTNGGATWHTYGQEPRVVRGSFLTRSQAGITSARRARFLVRLPTACRTTFGSYAPVPPVVRWVLAMVDARALRERMAPARGFSSTREQGPSPKDHQTTASGYTQSPALRGR